MSRLREEDDPYVVEEPSDEERALSSSEDEVEVLLHGTPDQKRKLIRECLTGESESSSDDEFQKEMEAELNTTMRTMEGKWKLPEMGTSSGTGQTGPAATSKYYDDIYFDSDSEDEDKTVTQDIWKKRKHQQRQILSNDELLYDPEEDNRDQEWVDSQRRGYRNQRRVPKEQQRTKPSAVPNSDAVLNCPACMTTLCLDCQSPLAWYFLSVIPFPVTITDFLEAEFYQWYDLHFLPFSIDTNLTKHNIEQCL
ncbi:E2F-associated phosphoprotein isoform X2 [Rissa tridactyla]|uniref:E2F-associated phosphoprotein isoform X2 n=1 Tax=Rissa tridactyla TaxID=75485 RepID=UPI0023BAD5CF|nr:E2F-associated phosphoprotein isoform X2 [Rissa tridactyla]